MDDLKKKYIDILRNKGIDPDSISYPELLEALNIEFDNSWYEGLNKWDYIIGFLSGSLGAIIPNLSFDDNGSMSLNAGDSWMRQTSGDFHNNRANHKFDADGGFTNKIFSHSGDRIDRLTDQAHLDNIPYQMHRLYGGHDIFQFSKDNIFLQMTEQYGFLGMIRSFVHLFYDFNSRVGLPLPGSSNFASTIYNEWCNHSPQIYENYFTLNIRDASSTGITWGLLTAYRFLDTKYWSGRDNTKEFPRYYRLNMLAYSCNVILGLATGTLNWFSVVAFSKSCIQHQMKQWEKTKILSKKVDELHQRILFKEIDYRPVKQLVSDIEDDYNQYYDELIKGRKK